ncbi:gastrula zinc finger protein XlCGF8.2DB-like [Penaeus monodon]|uniref:gastrula zinc finger protein XlCGF8.2DB-like n=1 Tax=Penaeus monodon TaxID=6687 RepID=UPI0018A79894|nr:gastrula zinc finger protein XlCGF8.2DB-like [Penaeus monodon]
MNTEEKPYSCELYNKAFSQKHNLSKIATEKPYKCEIETKNFSHIANLALHRRLHTEEKPYSLIHMRVQHKKEATQLQAFAIKPSHEEVVKINHMRVHTQEGNPITVTFAIRHSM